MARNDGFPHRSDCHRYLQSQTRNILDTDEVSSRSPTLRAGEEGQRAAAPGGKEDSSNAMHEPVVCTLGISLLDESQLVTKCMPSNDVMPVCDTGPMNEHLHVVGSRRCPPQSGPASYCPLCCDGGETILSPPRRKVVVSVVVKGGYKCLYRSS